MDNFQQAKLFLARVIHWPDANEEIAYTNIHWTFYSDQHKRNLWSGRACRSVNEAVKAIEWTLHNADTRDIYVCMSSQREAEEKISRKGFKYHAPKRSQANAVGLKSLFLDIDLKGGEHGYNTMKEAGDALGEFLQATDMPPPTMIVCSGNGFHVYWTLVRALRPEEWTPLAHALAEATKVHGLKCDTQVTIDSARVLRVPNTFNCKQEPRRSVQIIGEVKDFDYANERIERALTTYHTITATVLPVLAPLQGISDLAAGIEMAPSQTIKLRDVAIECPFVRDAIMTGGKTYTQPLWHLTTLLSTFLVDGRDAAHRMGMDHPGYTKESTDEMYDRKVKDQESKNLGWPSCKTISGTGATQCQSCPHFSAGKSPLNFATRKAASQVPALPVDDLPAGFTRLPSGVIASVRHDPETGETETIPICSYPMTDPVIQEGEEHTLHFSCKIGKVTKRISMPLKITNTMEMRPCLQGQQLIMPSNSKRAAVFGGFMASWIEQLQQTRESVEIVPFGWNTNKITNKIDGFVFDGKLWKADGTSQPVVNTDKALAERYHAKGDVQKWRTASELVTNQKRPHLNAILASAFAAPLVKFTGQTGVLLSGFSVDSGAGKTSANKAAIAVWGNPITARQGLDDTKNSASGALGAIHSLPVYWDEVREDEHLRTVLKVIDQLTSAGRDKHRMYANTKLRGGKTFETLMVSCSNQSLLDFAETHTKLTDAMFVRIFEYEVPLPRDIPNLEGRINQADADHITGALNNNYGHIGLEYAKWLGKNAQKCEDDVLNARRKLTDEIQAENEERFWTTLIAAIEVGATYAKDLGFVDWDVAAIRTFMIDEMLKLRARRAKRPGDMTKAINAVELLDEYFGAVKPFNTVWTNKIHQGVGKPPKGSIRVVKDTTRLGAIHMQVGVEDKMVRFSNNHFREWLREKGYPPHATLKKLDEAFTMKVVIGHLGSGSGVSSAKIQLREINLSGHPELDFTE